MIEDVKPMGLRPKGASLKSSRSGVERAPVEEGLAGKEGHFCNRCQGEIKQGW